MIPVDPSKRRVARSFAAACGLAFASTTWALWLAVGLGELGTWVWVFELFANFRVQYMGLFALCVVALTIVRWRKTAIVALLGVAFTTATMAPYFQERVSAPTQQHHFRLLTFNLWFRNRDLERTVEFVRASGADVVVFQEVDVARVGALARLLPAYPYYVTTPSADHGLALFSRWPVEADIVKLPGSATRIARARVQWRGMPLTMIGAHLHWPLSKRSSAKRAAELQILAEMARVETGPLLIAGDFNLTPWSRFFARFVSRSGLADCALGQGLLPTWPAQALPLRIRIDHCFASRHWRVQQIAVGPTLGSDHLPTVVDLELTSDSLPREAGEG